MQRLVAVLWLTLFTAVCLLGAGRFALAEGQASGLPRQVFVTIDSAHGWSPSVELEQSASGTASRYLAAMDAGRYAEAYSLLADMNRQETFEAYSNRLSAFNATAGKVIERRIVRITWTKDPANAPTPGVYAAIDLASRFQNIDRHCGYLVLHQPSAGGDFKVMREESNFMNNEVARDIAKQHSAPDVEAAWAKLSAACPNYESPVAAPQPPLPEDSSSSIGYPTVAAALKDLHAHPQVKFSQQNGWTVAEDDAAMTFWSFPPPNDPAYPSAVRRQVIQEAGGSSVQMTVQCEASKAACDNLVRSFEELNVRMKAQLQGQASR